MPDLSKDCIEWSGHLNHKGYGRDRVLGKLRFMHRVMFKLTYGFLPPVVMHKCDNRKCIRPSHLAPGTHVLNVRDRDAKGRGFKKLSDEQVNTIVARGKWGTYQEMARVYGITNTRVFQILKFGGRHVIR